MFSAVKAVVEHYGRLDIMVNNACIVGNPGLGFYGATKFAVRKLTQIATQELAEYKITVNAYAPGAAVTPMLKTAAYEMAVAAEKSDEWALEQFATGITLGRLAQPEEVANVIAFLAGADSNYITGQTIIVDGSNIFH